MEEKTQPEPEKKSGGEGWPEAPQEQHVEIVPGVAYKKSLSGSLILRDRLAIERTKLSEERTSLSYIRTGMSLILGGLFFVGYFPPHSSFAWIGYITLFAGALFSLYGFYHNKKSNAFIKTVIEEMKG